MGLFDKWIKRVAEDAAERAVRDTRPLISEAISKGVIEAINTPEFKRRIRTLLWKSPRFRFIKWMQMEMQRVDPTIPNERAFKMAQRVLADNLKDERIEFGDDRYAWDQGGAIDLIHAYEIEYWEREA